MIARPLYVLTYTRSLLSLTAAESTCTRDLGLQLQISSSCPACSGSGNEINHHHRVRVYAYARTACRIGTRSQH